ncbi:MAG: hypothetical protein IAC58_00490 [Firmicutes bacterium]|uniref:Uncharacterized protein n=1 Tax=Candidatus Onthovivens merdipullorum TaxID=2840889 RepID=A0A9D9GWY4_9BACL|nr:hypothetical protein [Candidatus Onthovivens merdipullorum]
MRKLFHLDLKKLLIIGTIFLLINIIIGLILLFTINNPTYFYLFLITLPFILTLYLSFNYYYTNFSSDKTKTSKVILISSSIRILSYILSLALSLIYLYFMNLAKIPEICYVFETLGLLTITSVIGLMVK